MKKTCLLTFSFLVFLLSINFLSAKAHAITENLQVSSYELPYPGLLPDSPLYFLRMIRDRAVGFLISDPLKKSEFDLLQADKRLNAGIYLFNKGKTSLSLSTVSKAENYFEQALSRMEEAKIQGRNISEMERNLRNALKKHQQELEDLIKKVNVSFTASFEKELKRVASFDRWLGQ